jgi:hypothetical protein
VYGLEDAEGISMTVLRSMLRGLRIPPGDFGLTLS